MFRILSLLCFCFSVYACSTPVFRYALERWEPDSYDLKIFVDGKDFTKEQKEKLKIINEKSDFGYTPKLFITKIDIKDKEAMKEIKLKPNLTFPHIVLSYPKYSGGADLWSGDFKSVDQILLTSPKQKELMKKIAKGDAAVWIVLKGKDEKENSRVDKELSKILGEWNEQITNEDEEDAPQIKINFSVLEIDRDDKLEQMFIETLLLSEEELLKEKGTLLVPVFGRGRALGVLNSSKEDLEEIDGACDFITGQCSCEVKAQNPGWDLLLFVDWDEIIEEALDSEEEELPELIGPTTVNISDTALKPIPSTAPETKENNDATLQGEIEAGTVSAKGINIPDSLISKENNASAKALETLEEEPSDSFALILSLISLFVVINIIVFVIIKKK